jgi:hypothetical protein
MRRHLVGICSLVLLAGAGLFLLFPPTSVMATEWQAACGRMGLLLGLLWLAWPQAVRLPRWLLIAVPLAALVLVLRPRYFLFAIPLVIVLAIAVSMLMPRPAARRPAARNQQR